MANFETGKTYFCRSICDYDHVIEATIISRTAKTVKAETKRGTKTFRVFELLGNEALRPWGNYSMAPIITADRVSN